MVVWRRGDQVSEILLRTLDRLSANHPNYPGTIERDSIDEEPRLRYYPKPNEMIDESRDKWNNAVRSLDAIAIDVIAVLQGFGKTIPDAQTDGARVMFWMLQSDWKPNRVSISSLTNAFEKIRNELAKLCGDTDDSKYPGFTQRYHEMKADPKLKPRQKDFKAIATAYRNTLDKTTVRPSVTTLQNWIARKENQ